MQILTMPREYLTVAEAAALWRVSVPTIYRRCADGRLPHVRVGGQDGPIRIPAAALNFDFEHVPDDGPQAGQHRAGADPAERRGISNTGEVVEPAGAHGDER